MQVGQADVSKIERRNDILLSTMREYVEAAGGSLEIIVRLPDRPDLRLNFGSKGRPRVGRSRTAGARVGVGSGVRRRRHA